MAQIQRHPYHLVDQSPWPLTASLGCLSLTTGGVMYMHGYSGGVLTLTVGFLYERYRVAVEDDFTDDGRFKFRRNTSESQNFLPNLVNTGVGDF